MSPIGAAESERILDHLIETDLAAAAGEVACLNCGEKLAVLKDGDASGRILRALAEKRELAAARERDERRTMRRM